ncbi:DUF58 domain-containing protein [Candidatus Kapabacteria bacterium]|nr:DUF58 domain-containing protein [Candidatus Kapabacteria bacterium]
METSELIKKVRKIEIKTRGLSKQLFSGEYHSAFKGRGMAFSEVRNYYPGDEIRTIDWNVTARTGEPYVKVFEEERELTLMLIVDVSASENFGTKEQFKRELVTEICAILAFSAIQNNDKIGLILFSSEVELYIPPKKGKSHVLRIIRELIDFKPKKSGTNISEAMSYFNSVIKKRSIAFVLSDFIDDDFIKPMKIAARRHDTIALQVNDKGEYELPKLGLIQITDPETGGTKWIDSTNKRVRLAYSDWWKKKQDDLEYHFLKSNVDHIQINTGESYIAPLQRFFKKRESRR